MKTQLLLLLLVSLATLGATGAAEKAKSKGPKLFLTVTVERVQATYLVVNVDSYAEDKNGYLQHNRDRAGIWAVLIPGGKCAKGDKFEVWAWDDGVQTSPEAGMGDQPLRRFAVISAKRR